MQPRPTAITVICVLGFIGAAVTLPLALFTANSSLLPSWYTPYLLLSAVVGLACMIGIWRMKKAAVLGYTGFALANQVILGIAGLWNPMALIGPAILIAVCMGNISKMD